MGRTKSCDVFNEKFIVLLSNFTKWINKNYKPEMKCTVKYKHKQDIDYEISAQAQIERES